MSCLPEGLAGRMKYQPTDQGLRRGYGEAGGNSARPEEAGGDERQALRAKTGPIPSSLFLGLRLCSFLRSRSRVRRMLQACDIEGSR
jgi:hypothetical protein